MDANQQNQPPAENNKPGLLALINSPEVQRAPARLLEFPQVAGRFLELYKTFHDARPDAGNHYWLAEKFHLAKILAENPALAKCDPLSLYGCLLDLCVHGLSLDPSLKQTYLIPKGGKATLRVTAYGELFIRVNAGQFRYADNPVLVFEGDQFTYGTARGASFVEHRRAIPRKSDVAVACFVKLTRPDGSVDYKVLSREELEEYRKQSDQPNGPAWTRNYNGMFQNKTLKHAFKGYPRPRTLGATRHTELETEAEVRPPVPDIYGLGLPAVGAGFGEGGAPGLNPEPGSAGARSSWGDDPGHGQTSAGGPPAACPGNHGFYNCGANPCLVAQAAEQQGWPGSAGPTQNPTQTENEDF